MLKRGLNLFALLLIPAFMAFSLHKFYVSLVQMDYNEKNSSFEITMKIFTDDLENALKERSGLLLKLGTPDELPATDSILSAYISENFRLDVNGKELKYQYLGKEVELDVTWCYLEVSGVHSVEKIKVTDRMLTELFENQSNLIKIKYRDKESAALLNRNKLSDIIRF
jgi:hypothetical protein